MRRAMSAGVVVLCMVAVSASAAILNVPADYPGIQAGIDAARDGDTVLVAPGVYYETINFGGKNITVTSSDPNDPKVVGYSIINADGDGSVVTFENGETPAARLIGFTITGGFGTVDSTLGSDVPYFWGAGIYCKNASPTITRCVIANNQGPAELGGDDISQWQLGYGGGIGLIESDAVITHNTIRGNSAYVGGALLLYFGNARIENNLIYENSALVGAGATMIEGQLINNTILANEATNMGGGSGVGGNVYVVFDPTVEDCRVWNNIICNSTSGGLYYEGAQPRAGAIAFNDIWNNQPGNYCTIDPTTGGYIYDGQLDLTGTAGNISQDPLLADPLNRNYHLTLESPCINAGDPDYVPPAGRQDIDGQNRIYGRHIDIGADEYVGYVKPAAFAGPDRHVLDPSQAVTLDGSESFFYDPCGVRTFHWTQVGGPPVTLEDPNAEKPTFTPGSQGEYTFELVVRDDRYGSEPDRVLILVADNQVPVANAGADAVWQTPGLVTLDGAASHDPDRVDRLTYQWRQIEGQPVNLQNADSATPSFLVDTEGPRVFELIVSDGFAQSTPSRVQCNAVPVTTATRNFTVPLAPPTAGMTAAYHLDISGTRAVYTMPGASSYELRLACTDLMTKKAEVFFEGSTNIRPKIDGDLVTWFGGVSYQNNAGTECTSVLVHNLATGTQRTLRARSDTSSFSHPAVSGNKVVWLQQLNLQRGAAGWSNTPYDICGADLSDFSKPVYFTIATGVGRHELFAFSTFVSDYDDVVDISGNTVVWEADGDIYAADISDLNHIKTAIVCNRPGRQYDPAISGHFVVWTDERNDSGDIYGADLTDWANIREFAVVRDKGRQQQPAIDGPLALYVDGSVIRLACITPQYGGLRADFPESFVGVMPALDGRTAVWLANGYIQIAGASVEFGYSVFDGLVQNIRTGKRYDYVQHAIADANSGDTIVAEEGAYEEKFDFAGKAVTVRSKDPNDPRVVAATVFRDGGSIVSFVEGEGSGSVLAGVTLTGGSQGIYAYGASPVISRCVITGNLGAGVRLLGSSNPLIANCQIVANGGTGVDLSSPASESRAAKQAQVTLRNSLIAANRGQGVRSGKPTLINCTVVENQAEGISGLTPVVMNSIMYFNDEAGHKTQIDGTRATVSYSDIEGGWTGDGNIDADPFFVALGRWVAPTGSGDRVGAFDSGATWTAGDYHLKSQGWRWNAATKAWVSDDATSPCIDAGDPASELLDELLTAPGDPAGPVINQRIDMGAYGGTAEASLAPMNR